MTETTRREIVRMTLELAQLSRDIERAGKVAPRYRLDSTLDAVKRYENALVMFRLYVHQRTNFALSA